MTLHDRIRAVVEERLRLAREAVDGHTGTWKHNGPYESWLITDDGDVVVYDEGSPTEAQAEHIAANDPADAILSAEHALSVLERHRPETFAGSSVPEHLDLDPDEPWCRVCRGSGWPCPEILALATRWRVEVDE